MEVEWHYTEQVVKISLTNTYQETVEGLCGNFNGVLTDDIPAVTAGQVKYLIMIFAMKNQVF